MTRYTQPEIDWVEYEHFKSYNWDEQRIAARLGVLLSSLRTALARKAAKEAKKEKAA